MNLAKFSQALAQLSPQNAFADYDALTQQLEPDNDETTIAIDDGSVTITVGGDDKEDEPEEGDSGHFENLALKMDDMRLGTIASSLMEGIDADERGRSEWLETYAAGLDLLGLKIKKASSMTSGTGGPSTVQHPVLLEAVVRYASTALGELVPAGGPVKVAEFGPQTAQSAKRAKALERDFNFYLMNTASEFRPDTDQMLFRQGFCGIGIKKVYNCPRRRRPVSESVDPADFIVAATAVNLDNAGRYTHRIWMRPSVLKRMQLIGAYRKVEMSTPSTHTNVVADKEAAIAGVDRRAQRPEDEEHEILECYCELDLHGYEHKEDGAETGLPLPYRVTMERTSRTILSIVRNWNEDDDQYMAKKFFVLYPFINAFGIFGIGLLHLIGNSAKALTAAWRVLLDLGMFNSFPGFLYAKQAGRQQTHEFRIMPGSGMPIETGGQPLANVVQQLPYKEPSPAMLSLVENIEQTTQRVGGTAEIKVGEGTADTPVGTTVALIEQATKIEGAVHKRAHQAQSEEFQLLKERFREDPEAFWRFNKRPAMEWEKSEFIAALNTTELVPVSDPNTPSNLHRLMKASAILQLASANSDVLNKREAIKRALDMMDVDDPESLMVPEDKTNAPPPMDPAKQAEINIKEQTLELQKAKAASQAQQAHATLQSKNNIAVLQLAKETAIHPEAVQETQAVLHSPSLAQFSPSQG